MGSISRAALSLVVVAAACTGGGPGTQADDTPSHGRTGSTTMGGTAAPDDSYLDAIAKADRPIDEMSAQLFEAFNTRYTGRDAFLDAFTGVDVSNSTRAVLDGIRDIEPPAEYADEHERLVDSLRSMVAFTEAWERALAARDLGAHSIAEARFIKERVSLLVEFSTAAPALCRALTLGTEAVPAADADFLEEFDDDGCGPREGVPGGAYGQQANLIARAGHARVAPLLNAPFDLFTDDEEIAYLAEIQPLVEAEFASTRQRLAILPVPPQYARDHQAALTNLRDIADIARRITEAAEANDQQALPALYEESARPGIALRDALSPDGRVIFSVWTPPS